MRKKGPEHCIFIAGVVTNDQTTSFCAVSSQDSYENNSVNLDHQKHQDGYKHSIASHSNLPVLQYFMNKDFLPLSYTRRNLHSGELTKQWKMNPTWRCVSYWKCGSFYCYVALPEGIFNWFTILLTRSICYPPTTCRRNWFLGVVGNTIVPLTAVLVLKPLAVVWRRSNGSGRGGGLLRLREVGER